MRISWMSLLVLGATTSCAQDSSVGTHGMALLRVGEQVIASHMPLHGGKHAHQLIIKVRAESGDQQQDVLAVLNDEQLVSLLPEQLSLNALRAGNIEAFDAVLYRGHFERDGTPLKQQIEIVVEQRLLDKQVEDEQNGSFYWIALDARNGLLVHRIGIRPSFDQIVSVSNPTGQSLPDLLLREDRSPLTVENSVDWLAGLGLVWQRQLYLEVADFSVAAAY